MIKITLTSNFINIFASRRVIIYMAKKILIICPNAENTAPGQRLKYEQYFNSWRKDGWDITVEPFMFPKFNNIVYKKGNTLLKVWYTIIAYSKRLLLLFSVPKYDVVYYFLWVTPFGFPVFEWLYTKLSKNIIFDIDDLVYSKNNPHETKFLSLVKGKNKPIFLMKK